MGLRSEQLEALSLVFEELGTAFTGALEPSSAMFLLSEESTYANAFANLVDHQDLSTAMALFADVSLTEATFVASLAAPFEVWPRLCRWVVSPLPSLEYILSSWGVDMDLRPHLGLRAIETDSPLMLVYL